MIYADSSFLCSLYGWDANTARAQAVYSGDCRRPLLLTSWQRFEVRNAIRLAGFRLRKAGMNVPFDTGNILKRIDQDLAAGRLRHEDPDWRETFRLAEKLSAEHTDGTGASAGDLWHIALAVLLGSDTFWTFDEEQRSVAKAVKRFRRVPTIGS